MRDLAIPTSAPSRKLRLWLLAFGVLFSLAAASAAILIVKWPFTQSAVTQTLERRFARQVTVRQFRKTFFPPGCIAEEVDFQHRQRKDLPPLITIRKLIIRGSYSGMLSLHEYVPVVEVTGLHITVPPKSAGPSKSIMPLTSGSSNTLTLKNIDVDGAVLDFLAEDRKAKPFQVVIRHLKLGNVGGSGPMSYTAALRNTDPPGDVSATGWFGPWNPNEPGDSPLSGSYNFTNATLNVFTGIAGSLASRGAFTGTLARLHSDSTASVAGFHVEGGAQNVNLSTSIHADVDAVNGDTFLSGVDAHFLNTTVSSHGSIAGRPSATGKIVSLDLAVNDGRIDDLLRVFCASRQPSMTGHISFRAKAQVPPVSIGFLTKLSMEGDFGIAGGKFTNPAIEAPLSHVSESAAGENRKQQLADPRTTVSNLKGHVSVRGGTATLSDVSFTVPGGSARMKGSYNLLNHGVDIHGILYTDGNLSDATTGFKSLVLKIVTPFMKRKKTTVVPFTITGTSQDPKFALDFDGKRSL